jgi:hypothetical protein
MTLDEVASKIAVEYSEALEILGSEGGEQWH